MAKRRRRLFSATESAEVKSIRIPEAAEKPNVAQLQHNLFRVRMDCTCSNRQVSSLLFRWRTKWTQNKRPLLEKMAGTLEEILSELREGGTNGTGSSMSPPPLPSLNSGIAYENV